MPLTITKNAMRFVGQNSNAITTEIGCVIRKNAHPAVEKWGDIVKNSKCMEDMEKEIEVR